MITADMQKKKQHLIFSIASFLLSATTIAYLFSLLARSWWVFELVTHFYLHYFGVAALLVALFALTKKFGRATIALILAIVLASSVFPGFGKAQPDTTNADTILFANVHSDTSEVEQLVSLVDGHEPFVAAFAEMNQDLYEALRVELPDYTTSHYHDGQGPFDVAVFVHNDEDVISLETLTFFEDIDLPLLRIRLGTTAGTQTIFVAHPTPPITTRSATLRNDYLEKVAAEVQKEDSVIVVGDLNTTPYSPVFKDFLIQTELVPAGGNLTHPRTWPTWLPDLLRIPIDHGFMSQGVRASIVPADRIEGDHLPILIHITSDEIKSEG